MVLPDRGLFIVADGMGGRRAGATASKIVVEALPSLIDSSVSVLPVEDTESRLIALQGAIADLSRQICQQSASDPGLVGMGATVVLAQLCAGQALIAHVGDSRAYLYRSQFLERLTEDHSVVAILLEQEEITPEKAKDHPRQGQVSRYVGMDGEAYPGVQALDLLTGDRLLLCTDGLTGMVSDTAISAILEETTDPGIACRARIDAANAAGGRDNITALMVDWPEDESAT